jgi:chromosome segregation ATPase
MMNNEELDRKMAFIVEQQAQFTVDIQQLRESQAQTEQIVNRLAYVTNVGFKDVNAKIDALVDAQNRTEDEIRRLTDSQKKTDEQLKQTDKQLKQTDEHLKRTDEKFRKVLDRLDRRSDNGRNSD